MQNYWATERNDVFTPDPADRSAATNAKVD
jgi:hypothetical protein